MLENDLAFEVFQRASNFDPPSECASVAKFQREVVIVIVVYTVPKGNHSFRLYYLQVVYFAGDIAFKVIANHLNLVDQFHSKPFLWVLGVYSKVNFSVFALTNSLE
jgi:hypothetical protein